MVVKILLMKLLVADDSLLLRKSLVKLLESLNQDLEIMESSDIGATINSIAQYYPDVLILDLHFPDGYGYEVMDYIIDHDLEMVVIILTNLATNNNEARCYAKGAHHFLDKSNDYEKLAEVIIKYA
jgi:CheY-like chemotaxis protein